MEFPKQKPRLLIGMLIGIVLGAAGGWYLGWLRGKEDVRVEAVREGHARHRIMDEFGKTVFEWLPGQKGEFTAPAANGNGTPAAPK